MEETRLGCEVDSSDSEQTDGRPQNDKLSGKRGRFRNKFDKKAKFNQSDRCSKRRRYENSDSANVHNQNDCEEEVEIC